MRIVIVGCGRVGARLAIDFSQRGDDVSVIDGDSRSFRRLPEDFPGRLVLGTGIDEDVLRSAGVEEADVFVAVTENDNTNIMSAEIARRIFGIERVVLRIYDAVRAEIFSDLGLDVICPTATVAGLIQDRIFRDSPRPARA